MKYIKSISIIICFISYYSCTKEISVDVAHEKQTIIFGGIKNGTNSIIINIQQSVPLNSTTSFETVNDASVSVFTRNTSGTSSLVTDNFIANQGRYTSLEAITTTIGNKYWIEVTLLDGTIFKSEEETLKAIVPIEAIEISNEDIVSISFSDPSNDRNFYTFGIDLFLNGQLVSSTTSESNDVVFDGNDNASVEIDLFRFNDDDDDEVTITYDVLRARLQNINFSSYQFYLNQSAQIEANDSESSGDPSQLFATPPVNLLGNITNTTTNKIALGNFTVNSESIINQ